jgi:hypothetical protein
MSVTRAQYGKIALAFPGGNEKPSHGKPSFFIDGKFFTRWRDEEDSIVLVVGSIDERDMLLARASQIDGRTLRGMLERRWQGIAPKKLRAPAPTGRRGG